MPTQREKIINKIREILRAVKSEPDYFYVNKYLRILETEARELF